MKENVVGLTVYMKDPHVQKITRDVKITTTTFLSNVGGLLGLCQGFSIISFIEIIYFLTIWGYKRAKNIPQNDLVKVAPINK